ncbi:MAG TPA: hypothetical protein PLQ65_09515 [Flavihumibacter sp.]|nr:hypothetical protein [Bacteroidota bacterium]HQD09890.1 hypothetical protein [Flavihumibacter sp.]
MYNARFDVEETKLLLQILEPAEEQQGGQHITGSFGNANADIGDGLRQVEIG